MQNQGSETLVVTAAGLMSPQGNIIHDRYKHSPLITCVASSDIGYRLDHDAMHGFERQLDFVIANKKPNAIHCLVVPGVTMQDGDISTDKDEFAFLHYMAGYAKRIGIRLELKPLDGVTLLSGPERLVCHSGAPQHLMSACEMCEEVPSLQCASPAAESSFAAHEKHIALFMATVRAAMVAGVREIVMINNDGCTPFMTQSQDPLKERAKLFRKTIEAVDASVQHANTLSYQFVYIRRSGEKFVSPIKPRRVQYQELVAA